jgi:hypothetical protein
MTDNLESLFAKTYDLKPGHHVQPADTSTSRQPLNPPEEVVTVELPVDVLAALDQQRCQSGQTQTQVILDVLRSALGLSPAPTDSAHASQSAIPASNSDATALQSAQLMAEIEDLKTRLSQLETVMQRVEVLEGKSIAF